MGPPAVGAQIQMNINMIEHQNGEDSFSFNELLGIQRVISMIIKF